LSHQKKKHLYYWHYCENCGTVSKQRFEGFICDGLDDFHRKMFPKYYSAYSMTCFKCKSTRTYDGTGRNTPPILRQPTLS
jgi:hypothetical protein